MRTAFGMLRDLIQMAAVQTISGKYKRVRIDWRLFSESGLQAMLFWKTGGFNVTNSSRQLVLVPEIMFWTHLIS